MALTPAFFGVDFTSRPSRSKPIALAEGRLDAGRLRLDALRRFESDEAFVAWIDARPAWVGAFDLPFGLPRELVEQLGWPTDWARCIEHYTSLERQRVREIFAAFCAARPPGAKFAHRRCDRPAGSSPSMKWVHPPVAYMLHAGVPLLRRVGAWFPAHEPRPARGAPRVALEAYPGLPARRAIGRRSYKSDGPAGRTAQRRQARHELCDHLERGLAASGLALPLSRSLREELIEEPGADALDAVVCLVQAAWAALRPGWGLPPAVDPLEGWIVGA